MSTLNRRQFQILTATLTTGGLLGWAELGYGQEEVSALEPKQDKGVLWYDVQQWGVEGRGWSDTARYFDRLPARAEKTVRNAVWGLSRHSAGMSVRFQTDATAIHARYSLSNGRLALPHMPATGVSGLDLYARTEQGQDRWLAVARPTQQKMEIVLAGTIDRPEGDKLRQYTIYLPLYNGVEQLEIGVPEGAQFEAVPARQTPPIVFYGTSIMHGACASRPGMSITGIVERRLQHPTINLGFSGNGTMDESVGALLAELNAAVYVIDCLPNMQAATVAERTAPLVRQLRKAQPKTPILLVEDRTYAYARWRKSLRDRHVASRQALSDAYKQLRSEGIGGLHYLEGDTLLGKDDEATTDGSHPNDLGMTQYADAYEVALRKILSVSTDASAP